MEETNWSGYGRASGNPKCGDCMVHCGYEPAAVEATFGSLAGLLATARLTLFGAPKRPLPPLPEPAPLRVQANGLHALPVLGQSSVAIDAAPACDRVA